MVRPPGRAPLDLVITADDATSARWCRRQRRWAGQLRVSLLQKASEPGRRFPPAAIAPIPQGLDQTTQPKLHFLVGRAEAGL
jgi:hypothetical protein